MQNANYFDQLKQKMDAYTHAVYSATKSFPREELYGVTSQLRRATLSVILNFIEGFARKRSSVKKNFWEVSYGSFKESKYLLHFSVVEGYIEKQKYEKLINIAEEIGAMLWRAVESISSSEK